MLFFFALLLYFSTTYHALSSLLAIEFLALNIFTSLTLASLHLYNDSFSSLYFLTLAVCEGALGLSLVIILARAKGKDLLSVY